MHNGVILDYKVVRTTTLLSMISSPMMIKLGPYVYPTECKDIILIILTLQGVLSIAYVHAIR
uniref:Uncharacterized protein n=1 Tax=Brassica oleracea TaxID=3712 RepID=A0A3P6BS96_BRAOL|nr:unnamed protein product [Brassica oleracea]